jgi:hypothetical protein
VVQPNRLLVVKTQFDPVIPKSETLPDVILNEEVVATPGSTAESQDEVFTTSLVKTPISSASIPDPVVPKTEKPPAAPVEISATLWLHPQFQRQTMLFPRFLLL